MHFRRRVAGFLLAAAATAGAGRAAVASDAPVLTRAGVGRVQVASPPEQPWSLTAVLAERKLYLRNGLDTARVFDVAIGAPDFPTPAGSFSIRRIIWNPGWTPPPDAEWARGQRAREPGDPRNPMKTAKIFFQEPDYYIHGTGDVNSMGQAASHGCLRMRPEDVASLASQLMAAGGVKHDWSWVKRTLRLGSTRTVNLGIAVPLTIEQGVAPADTSVGTVADIEAGSP